VMLIFQALLVFHIPGQLLTLFSFLTSTTQRSIKGRLSSSGSFDEESEYASSRYSPPFKTILMDLVSNQLSTDEYPSVIPMPMSASSTVGTGSARRRGKGGMEGSARNKGGATDKWGKVGSSTTSQANGSNYVGGRSLVFMVGGISYSELRVARDVMQKESREIITGSTKFISPSDFLSDLHSLAG
jgi:syntaxin-binding protein 1